MSSWINWCYGSTKCKRCDSKITVYPCPYCGFKPGHARRKGNE